MPDAFVITALLLSYDEERCRSGKEKAFAFVKERCPERLWEEMEVALIKLS